MPYSFDFVMSVFSSFCVEVLRCLRIQGLGLGGFPVKFSLLFTASLVLEVLGFERWLC